MKGTPIRSLKDNDCSIGTTARDVMPMVGGIGPPLMEHDWVYGKEPENIFDTIVKGRPNGMPTWGGRIPENQIWQIVTYVRSLSDLEPKSATPARPDGMEQRTDTLLPRPAKRGEVSR